MPADAEALPPLPASGPDSPPSPSAPVAPSLSPQRRRLLLVELAVVLALAVIPDTIHALWGLVWPGEGDFTFAYLWVQIMVRSSQVSAVVLFILWRSGEPWSAFGLSRPRWKDIPLGLGLYVLSFLVYAVLVSLWWPLVVQAGLTGSGSLPRMLHSGPSGSVAGYSLLLVMSAANGFAEELVMRAYLITRLRHLGVKPTGAVLVSAALFAGYHVYQGFWGASTAFVDGLVMGIAFVALRRLWPVAICHAVVDVVVYL